MVAEVVVRIGAKVVRLSCLVLFAYDLSMRQVI